MTRAALSLERSVIDEVVRLAALEVDGVQRLGRGGPRWRRWRRAVVLRVAGQRVDVHVWLVARPGRSLAALVGEVRAAVRGAVERLLGLELGAVTIVVDGVGGPRRDAARPATAGAHGPRGR